MIAVPDMFVGTTPMRTLAAPLVVGAVPGVVIASIDGPFLGGLAAVIGSIFTGVLGILTLLEKRHERRATAAGWEALARELLAEKDADA